MCKVSTLRNIEPPSINVFCKTDQLPKINKSHHLRQPLVFIDEQNGLDFSLPQLKEVHLPSATSVSPVTSQIFNECESTDCITSKKDHDDLPKCRRPSTPFVTANLHGMSPTSNQAKESSVASAVPLATDRKKVLHRPRICATLSYPGVNGNSQSKVNNMSRVPTPPKSAPKNRPATPFLLTRSHSVDSKKYRYNLQALGETKSDIEDIGNPEAAALELIDKGSFMGKKIERDKWEESSAEKMPVREAMLAGNSCKIRMDMGAFTKWIEEHRLP